MARLTSELMVRLIDGVTKPAAGIARAVGRLGGTLNANNGMTFGQNIADASMRANASLDAMRGRMFDAIAVGYMLQRAISAPITAAIEFETVLEDMGQKADIPRERLGALGEQIKQVARDTNQATMDIAAAVDQMLGKGASQQVAIAAAAPIGQAATAYTAATSDLADASFAAVQNLGVAASDIGFALDAMAYAGKQGAFEIKDMAGELPSLAANYGALGQTGVQAVADISSALQIMRRGTGTSGEAATNLGEVLTKIFAPATVRAFKKEGVDIFEEMAAAADRGLDPIEAIAEITNETLNGDMSRLGFLFGDKQAQNGLRSLIAGLEDYRRIRDEAMGSEGTVSDDYLRRMETAAMAGKRWSNAMQNLSITIGSTLLPTLSALAEKMIPIIGAIGDWAAAHPELTANIITATAALVGFKIGMTALAFAGLYGKASALSALALAFGAVGKAGGAAKAAIALQTALAAGGNYTWLQKVGTAIGAIVRVTPGLNIAASAIGLIGSAIGAIGFGGLAIIGGFAAAGVLIWKYWDRLGAIFSGVGSVISEMIPDFQLAQPVADAFAKAGEAMQSAWGGVKGVLDGLGALIGGLFSQEVLTDEQKAQVAADAREWAQNILTPIAALPGQIVSFFSGLGAQILAAIGSIDLGSLIRWPDFSGRPVGTQAPQTASPATAPSRNDGLAVPGYAKGGPIAKGTTAIVGDGGEPEFFTAGADGYITPFSRAGSVQPATGGGGGKGGKKGPGTFAPSFVVQGNVYGVDDLEQRFTQFAAKMKAEYESQMAGTFADTETA